MWDRSWRERCSLRENARSQKQHAYFLTGLGGGAGEIALEGFDGATGTAAGGVTLLGSIDLAVRLFMIIW